MSLWALGDSSHSARSTVVPWWKAGGQKNRVREEEEANPIFLSGNYFPQIMALIYT